MQNGVQINHIEVLSDKKFRLKNYNYQLFKDGKATEKDTEVYFRPDAVAVLLYNPEEQTLLLTRQFRLPAYLNGVDTGYMTEVCAGLVDEGEVPETTACREAEEETGLAIKRVIKIGEAYTSVGSIPEKVHLFIAPYNTDMQTGKGGGLKSEGEDIDIIKLTFDEAGRLLKNGQFNDMKTILLLQHFFLNNI